MGEEKSPEILTLLVLKSTSYASRPSVVPELVTNSSRVCFKKRNIDTRRALFIVAENGANSRTPENRNGHWSNGLYTGQDSTPQTHNTWQLCTGMSPKRHPLSD